MLCFQAAYKSSVCFSMQNNHYHCVVIIFPLFHFRTHFWLSLLSYLFEKGTHVFIMGFYCLSWNLQMCPISDTELSSQRKELFSVLLSHSTLHVLLILLGRPTSESLTCSGCEASCWVWGCPVGLLCSYVSDSFLSESALLDLQNVRLLSFEWSLYSLLRWSLMSWESCVCCCPSEWLSALLFWSRLFVRWWGSTWLSSLSEHCLVSALCLCGSEQWVCSWESKLLFSLWKWFWCSWFCQKALRSCSNSESRGKPISRCISRFSSHSSSFEKEGLKEWKTESCGEKFEGLSNSTAVVTKNVVGCLALDLFSLFV